MQTLETSREEIPAKANVSGDPPANEEGSISVVKRVPMAVGV